MLLCLLSVGTAIAKTDAPKRDYKTVNFDNGIISRVLEIGTTSVTFAVECTPSTVVPQKLVLIGKLNLDWDAWNFWGEMEVVQTQGMYIVEYPYDWFLNDWDPPIEPDATMFATKAFFSLQKFTSDEEWEKTWGADGYGTNGVISPPLNVSVAVTAGAMVQDAGQGEVQVLKPSREGKSEIRNDKLEVQEPVEASHFWLYFVLALCAFCAVLYSLRKKLTMKYKCLFFALFCLGASCAIVLTLKEVQDTQEKTEEAPFLTREEIIQPEPEDDFNKDKSRDRRYAEVDLNDDGLKDIIISDPGYTGGTGGVSWGVYLCVSTNQYKGVGGMFGNMLALEDDCRNWGSKRIWSYSHISGWSGTVQYLYFEDGEGKLSPALVIYTGDGGTDMGNGIYNAIFANNPLELKWTPLDDEKESKEDNGKAVGESP